MRGVGNESWPVLQIVISYLLFTTTSTWSGTSSTELHSQNWRQAISSHWDWRTWGSCLVPAKWKDIQMKHSCFKVMDTSWPLLRRRRALSRHMRVVPHASPATWASMASLLTKKELAARSTSMLTCWLCFYWVDLMYASTISTQQSKLVLKCGLPYYRIAMVIIKLVF